MSELINEPARQNQVFGEFVGSGGYAPAVPSQLWRCGVCARIKPSISNLLSPFQRIPTPMKKLPFAACAMTMLLSLVAVAVLMGGFWWLMGESTRERSWLVSIDSRISFR